MGTTDPSPPSGLDGPTRTVQTERGYLRRALLFESRAAREMGLPADDDVDPREVAARAIGFKPQWARATWRQMKAALLFRYRAMGTEAALAAVAMLEAEGQSECLVRSKKTSALRKKSVSDDDLRSVITRIRNSRSRYAGVLESWILLGSLTGLRPHEWTQAELITASPSEIGDYGREDDHRRPYLRIRNAKNTNGRSHGEFRHLDLSGMKAAITGAIADFASLMTAIAAAGEYQRYYNGCQRQLSRMHKRYGSGCSRGKRTQIYSSRHRFSSDAKITVSLEEVAALMGHATNKTASRHYGKRNSASGAMSVRPVAPEVARVKRKKTELPGFMSPAGTKSGARSRRKVVRDTPES